MKAESNLLTFDRPSIFHQYVFTDYRVWACLPASAVVDLDLDCLVCIVWYLQLGVYERCAKRAAATSITVRRRGVCQSTSDTPDT